MEIFTVGGAVRDELMGKTPKDVDYVVVGATPEEMIAEGFQQVGADFPVFLHPTTGDEYALARTERKTGVGYLGFEVTVDPQISLEEDLFRRDLTINAIAKAADGTFIDPYDGRDDINRKILRHVSPAFAEDPLRVVRLARFYTRFSDFKIAPETLKLAADIVESGELNHLPHERFWAELHKVMEENDPMRFFMAAAIVGMDKHVHFFNEVYGILHIKQLGKMWQVTEAVMSSFTDPADRVMFHTAISAMPYSKTIGSAPVRLQKLYVNIQRMRELRDVTPDGLFDLFQEAKAWSQSPDMDDLIKAVDVMRMSGERWLIGARRLRRIVDATREVVAAHYPEFEGKELGEAIKQGRKNAIINFLSM